MNHPAMAVSLCELGSLVLEIDGDQLDARFLSSDGTVRDHFRIEKRVSHAVPSLPLTLWVLLHPLIVVAAAAFLVRRSWAPHPVSE
jgi:hypothetical protein